MNGISLTTIPRHTFCQRSETASVRGRPHIQQTVDAGYFPLVRCCPAGKSEHTRRKASPKSVLHAWYKHMAYPHLAVEKATAKAQPLVNGMVETVGL
jgi:hypothetical protein